MAEDEAYQAKEKSTEKQEEINSLTADLAATKLQWDELSGSRDPKHRYLMGTPATLEKFPTLQDRDTDKVQVGQTHVLAWDIRTVQRGEIIEHPRQMPIIGNVLSPIIRTSAEELMKCLDQFTGDSIEATQKKDQENGLCLRATRWYAPTSRVGRCHRR